MDNVRVFSESDVTNSGLSWGKWKFSLPEEKILEKLNSLRLPKEVAIPADPEEERWENLFAIVKASSNRNEAIVEVNTALNSSAQEIQMEISDVGNIDTACTSKVDTSNIQDLSGLVVDTCNKLVAKLKCEYSEVQEELEPVVKHLIEVDQTNLKSVMEHAWCQLQSDESKLAFCVVFTSTVSMCESLCKYVLLPWLSVHHASKLELLSSILSKEADIVCTQLIVPLLQIEHSPWMEDLPGVEELMSAMSPQHWTLLLKELLGNLKELQEWQLLVLAVVIRNAEPSYQELQLLLQLMSSSSAMFDQNRDFGALATAVASSLRPDSAVLVPQLKAIVDCFKGSLKVTKLKTWKIIADISDS